MENVKKNDVTIARELEGYALELDDEYPELAEYFRACKELVQAGERTMAEARARNGDTATETVARYGELWDLRALVKDVRKGLAATLRELGNDVLDVFGRTGVQNISFEDRTVYVRHFTRAYLKDSVMRSDAAEMLKTEAPELVSEGFNLNSVSSWARKYLERMDAEPREAEDVLPDNFLEAFGVKTSVSPQVKS